MHFPLIIFSLAQSSPPPAPPAPLYYLLSDYNSDSITDYGCWYYYYTCTTFCAENDKVTDANGCCGCDQGNQDMGWYYDSWGMTNGHTTPYSCTVNAPGTRLVSQSAYCRVDDSLLLSAYIPQPWEWSGGDGSWTNISDWTVGGYDFLTNLNAVYGNVNFPDNTYPNGTYHSAVIKGGSIVSVDESVEVKTLHLGSYPYMSTVDITKTLTVNNVYVAHFPRALGKILLQSTDANMIVNGVLRLGQYGMGMLEMSNGQMTISTAMSISASKKGTGTMLLSGGSMWAQKVIIGKCETGFDNWCVDDTGDGGQITITGGNHTIKELYVNIAESINQGSDFHKPRINILNDGVLRLNQTIYLEDVDNAIYIHSGTLKITNPWGVINNAGTTTSPIRIGEFGKFRYFDLGFHDSQYANCFGATGENNNHNCICSADGNNQYTWLVGNVIGDNNGNTLRHVRLALDESIELTHTLERRCVYEPELTGFGSQYAIEFYAQPLPARRLSNEISKNELVNDQTNGRRLSSSTYKTCGAIPGYTQISPFYKVFVRDNLQAEWDTVHTYYTFTRESSEGGSQYIPGDEENLHGFTHSFANLETDPGTPNYFKIETPYAIRSIRVEPEIGSIVTSIEGNVAFVTIIGNVHVHIDINQQFRGEPWPLTHDLNDVWSGNPGSAYSETNPPKHALTIHTNPRESAHILSRAGIKMKETTDTVASLNLAAGDTVYFKPGIHRFQEQNSSGITVNYLTVVSGVQYYIPCDALIKGSFYSSSASDVIITGYGIITGEHRKHPGDEPAVSGINNIPMDCNGATFERCAQYSPVSIIGSNLTVYGVTVTDAPFHTFRLQDNTVSYTKMSLLAWVKTITWRQNGDGTITSPNQRVQNVFFRCQDDSYYVDGHGIKDAVIWNDYNGASLLYSHVGGDMSGTNRVEHVVVENVHVLYSRANTNHWPNGGVIAHRGQGTPGDNNNHVVTKNIYVTDPYQTHPGFKFMSYTPRASSAYSSTDQRIIAADAECSSVTNIYCYQWYGWPTTYKRGGDMNNLHFENIYFENGNANNPQSAYYPRREVFFGWEANPACYSYTLDSSSICIPYETSSCDPIDTNTCDLTSTIRATFTNIHYGNQVVTETTALANWVTNAADLTFSGAGSPAPSPPPGQELPTYNPPPPPFGQAMQDPHLTFGHGGKADFSGDDDVYYLLLAAPGLNFAARSNRADFLLPRPQLIRGTFFTSVAWVIRGWNQRPIGIISNASDTPGFNLYYMDTKTLIRNYTGVWKEWWSEGLRVYYKQSTIFVRARGWEMNATRHPIYNHLSGKYKWRFDIAMRPLNSTGFEKFHGNSSGTCFPHGIIGQSWDGDEWGINGAQDNYTYNPDSPMVVTKAQAEGAIEGKASDYKMTHAFDTNTVFSRYKKIHKNICPPRNISKLTGKRIPYVKGVIASSTDQNEMSS